MLDSAIASVGEWSLVGIATVCGLDLCRTVISVRISCVLCMQCVVGAIFDEMLTCITILFCDCANLFFCVG